MDRPKDREISFVARGVATVAALSLIVGIIYATGIGKNHRTAGVVLIILSALCAYSAWSLLALKRRNKN
jgi:hypothetical protein